jgi:2-polyprenyl-6-methoxyphenol hydroxylase-like FAD-dependent oxidoreductase
MNAGEVRVADLPVIDTDVLVVGAGPTGLMAGLVLSRRGVPAVVVDRKAGPTRESRALAVQARTMEIYDQLGLAETVLAGAFPAMRVQIGQSASMVSPDLSLLQKGATRFPGIQIFEQSRNEQLLADTLVASNEDIRWRHRLVDLIDKTAQPDGRVEALIEGEDGGLVRVRARWCIGADGASSAVRRALNLQFDGKTDDATFWVADVRDVRGVPEGTLNMRFGKSTFAVAFPLGPGGHTRLVALAPHDDITQDEARSGRLVFGLSGASPRGLQVPGRIGLLGRRRRTRAFPGRGPRNEHRSTGRP